jgi:hypothetical protein
MPEISEPFQEPSVKIIAPFKGALTISNRAKGMVACEFLVSVTASFRVLYVFVRDGDRLPGAFCTPASPRI